MNTKEKINELLEVLKTRLSNCQQSKEKNRNQNCGLSGSINTTNGLLKEKFLNGKIEILNYCIDELKKIINE